MGCSHLPPVKNKTVVQVICMHSIYDSYEILDFVVLEILYVIINNEL